MFMRLLTIKPGNTDQISQKEMERLSKARIIFIKREKFDGEEVLFKIFVKMFYPREDLIDKAIGCISEFYKTKDESDITAEGGSDISAEDESDITVKWKIWYI